MASWPTARPTAPPASHSATAVASATKCSSSPGSWGAAAAPRAVGGTGSMEMKGLPVPRSWLLTMWLRGLPSLSCRGGTDSRCGGQCTALQSCPRAGVLTS
jgi:hypothetical protein